MSKVTIGGDRLGSGKKMKADLRTYNRSTHDLSYMWKSTMSVGTLVPFMSEIGLPGDSFGIKLDADVRTIPTNGPLFGSFKVQLDIFQIPIRLFIKELHNNALNVGMNMSNIYLPQVELSSVTPNPYNDASYDNIDFDNYQVHSSCIFKYLNIAGCQLGEGTGIKTRQFNALTWLSYWSIYKNYYANKQEEIGAVIHTPEFEAYGSFTSVSDDNSGADWTESVLTGRIEYNAGTIVTDGPSVIIIEYDPTLINYDLTQIVYTNSDGTYKAFLNDPSLAGSIEVVGGTLEITIPYSWRVDGVGEELTPSQIKVINFEPEEGSGGPRVVTFPLDEIDKMKEYLLMNSTVILDADTDIMPYSLALQSSGTDRDDFKAAIQFNQEGLALKTYQSDLFNNWLSTEYLDGENGINEITKVQVDADGFYLDDLNIMKKIYFMLNRVAISDGSYRSWLETVYDQRISNWVVESPQYLGGLIKELSFDEVISTAGSESQETDQPLGTLAGKGSMTPKHKGGYVDARIEEPSYIMGLVSLTPRIDYSQGNKWDTQLQTMDDFHKPQLDQIGFQELITDQMAWFDTKMHGTTGEPVYKSAGKQPAWINYMTNVNQVRGNFAIDGGEMFMTLNRKYDVLTNGQNEYYGIKDMTTYIDPSKFNDVFSYNKLDAQNFWTQIKVGITARRKMSAKVMPNL